MAAAVKTRKLTFEDFCLRVRDGEKADLIDGVIYKMASPDNMNAGKLFVWLSWIIGGFVEELDLGEIYGSRIAFRLAAHQGPEPDIAFVSRERTHLERYGFFEGAPDLAMEIVSPESRLRDYIKKKKQYQEAGVREYWIIDEMEQRVVLYRLASSGRYREVKPKKGVYSSEVLPGFWLRAEWLWQSPLPKKKSVLQEILAGVD